MLQKLVEANRRRPYPPGSSFLRLRGTFRRVCFPGLQYPRMDYGAPLNAALSFEIEDIGHIYGYAKTRAFLFHAFLRTRLSTAVHSRFAL